MLSSPTAPSLAAAIAVIVSSCGSAARGSSGPAEAARPPAPRPRPVPECRIEGGVQILANEHLSVETRVSANYPEGARARNLRTGSAIESAGDDFWIQLEGGARVPARSLRLSKVTLGKAPEDGRLATIELVGAGLCVTRTDEIRPGQHWLTRRLEIRREAAGPTDPAAAAPTPLRVERVSLGSWRCPEAAGQPGPGAVVSTLGYPSGCGQPAYAADLFLAIAHPAAENFVRSRADEAGQPAISLEIPVAREIPEGGSLAIPPLVIGAGQRGAARRAFLGYVDATRAVPSRMLILVNDWYWKDKARPIDALGRLARVKAQTGVPVDSFTLDDGWDLDWDAETGLWGRLNRGRFPGGWDAMVAAGRADGIDVSLWFGPIGGYGGRDKRVAKGGGLGFETNGDKLCLAGPRYRAHAVDSFARWARLGMDYIKVDGFWPDCARADHGHPPAPAGAAAQMDALAETFAAWREAKPDLLIGYTSGSSPSPFWLQHADFVWRGGADDSHAGAGEPFDRHSTYIDACLQAHRLTEMPMSAFVTFDIVQDRVVGSSSAAFERGAWWLAARTSLHHDWYVQAEDLDVERWKLLARVAAWAKAHEGVFRWSRMVGGDPGKGEVYGFAAWDAGAGTLALRNPAAEPRTLEATIADLLGPGAGDLPAEIEARPVFGETRPLDGRRAAAAPARIELPGLGIAIWEVEAAK